MPESPESARSLSRREFTALSLAAAAVATTSTQAAGTLSVSEQQVQVKTPSGTSDASLCTPQGAGTWPAVILFTDAGGLRQTMADMGKRLAGDGYVVLVPNPYYRNTKPPGLDLATFNFADPADRAKLEALRAPLTNEAVAQDATAYLTFLDALPAVNRKVPAGAFGYCMGGLMTLQAAIGNPNRIHAGASFHGGGLVTDQPDSVHRQIGKVKGRFLIAIAANDDERQPEAKTELSKAFAAAHIPATVEVYPGTQHGWCVSDMPHPADKPPVYDRAQAERAWSGLQKLFKTTLV
ncbi:MAG TPA: dienelactone hydrolase family protein [Steroidobacteraceae bacterium]|nr:dienelactone hydrolase family protein [Steroidobacteraceae bacterium]